MNLVLELVAREGQVPGGEPRKVFGLEGGRSEESFGDVRGDVVGFEPGGLIHGHHYGPRAESLDLCLSPRLNSTTKVPLMRVNASKLTPGFLLALLAACLFLAPSGMALAQSRSFQMALWVNPGSATPSLKQDTDIQAFYEGTKQPDGPSIMLNLGWTSPTPLSQRQSPSGHLYDWSRIVAVEIDEPYSNNLPSGTADPCKAGTIDGVNMYQQVLLFNQVLRDKANELKSLNALTRFWVNFTPSELDWKKSSCFDVNQAYIDVISLDDYHVDFDTTVKPYYNDLITNATTSPEYQHQQLALFPGTFVQPGDDAMAQEKRLSGYFNYATTQNQSCNVSLGSRGITGSYDGCRVWIVMGYLSGDTGDYTGMLDLTLATTVAQAWRDEKKMPVRPDLLNQLTPSQVLPDVLPLLLAN